MAVATVTLLAQLAVQLAGHRTVGVQTASTGSLDRWEKEVSRPWVSWLACQLEEISSTHYIDVFDIMSKL